MEKNVEPLSDEQIERVRQSSDLRRFTMIWDGYAMLQALATITALKERLAFAHTTNKSLQVCIEGETRLRSVLAELLDVIDLADSDDGCDTDRHDAALAQARAALQPPAIEG